MANSIDIVVENRKGDEAEAAASASSVLTRVNAGYFTISLSLGAQAVLLNTLIDDHATTKLKFYFNLVVADRILGPWAMLMTWLSLCTLALISSLYILRCVFHLWLVKAEYSDRVAVNFLFVPWISWLLLLRATPQRVLLRLPHEVLLWALVAPIVALDVKLYGQWFTSEKRSLSAVANPTSHLPMVGNFVGAWAAAGVGWRETALCLFAVGLVHYVVVFITLYQRLTGFRAALRPISFLFFGTPSAACLAWSAISGGFGVACKMLFFLSLFLLASLMCRPAYFKKSIKKFSVAWWAYSFPVSFVAVASTQYAEEVKGVAAGGLMLLLSSLSLLVFVAMLILTALNTDRLLRQNDSSLSFT
ncbi:S-type anion channel SLAH1-like [Salvia splendens]|uniref:S-type anion channel SLAH1-like n=1 Tax=Salvia splendens TaxID=180675 RepID=UPI0011036E10|nr:S-type anion channel SLAH1-like [Salvia splendens]